MGLRLLQKYRTELIKTKDNVSERDITFSDVLLKKKNCHFLCKKSEEPLHCCYFIFCKKY